jgi:hypothetical protein
VLFFGILGASAIGGPASVFIVREDNSVQKFPFSEGLTLRAAIVRANVVALHADGVLLTATARIPFSDKKLKDTHPVGKTLLHPGDIIVFEDLDAAREQIIRAAVGTQ